MKLSTQTRRMSRIGGFYDKNSSLWFNLKSRRFEGGGGLFSMQDSVSNEAENHLSNGSEISDIMGGPLDIPFVLIPSSGSF